MSTVRRLVQAGTKNLVHRGTPLTTCVKAMLPTPRALKSVQLQRQMQMFERSLPGFSAENMRTTPANTGWAQRSFSTAVPIGKESAKQQDLKDQLIPSFRGALQGLAGIIQVVHNDKDSDVQKVYAKFCRELEQCDLEISIQENVIKVGHMNIILDQNSKTQDPEHNMVQQFVYNTADFEGSPVSITVDFKGDNVRNKQEFARVPSNMIRHLLKGVPGCLVETSRNKDYPNQLFRPENPLPRLYGVLDMYLKAKAMQRYLDPQRREIV